MFNTQTIVINVIFPSGLGLQYALIEKLATFSHNMLVLIKYKSFDYKQLSWLIIIKHNLISVQVKLVWHKTQIWLTLSSVKMTKKIILCNFARFFGVWLLLIAVTNWIHFFENHN